MSRPQEPKGVWEPMDTPPTEEHIEQMVRGWRLWESEQHPVLEAGEWGFDLITKRWFQKVAK